MVTVLAIRAILMLWVFTSATIGVIRASMAKSGCPDKCGTVTIPYPFGIGLNCSANHTYSITCNNSKPFLSSINLEVLEILPPDKVLEIQLPDTGTIRVNVPVTKSGCGPASSGGAVTINLSGTPFSYSITLNQLIGIGCNSVARMFDLTMGGEISVGGCLSMCKSSGDTPTSDQGCYGINCCQTALPPIQLKMVNVSLAASGGGGGNNGCRYGFMVEQDWFGKLRNPYVVEGMEYVPVVLDWGTDEKCYMREIFPPPGLYINPNFTVGCYCLTGYQGNAYLPNGCTDINECEDPNTCPAPQYCYNYLGGHECRDIPKGPQPKPNRTIMFVVVGICSGLGGLFLILGSWGLWKIIKKRKEAQLKKKFFKRNGGLLFQQQQLPSTEQGYAEKTKLFTSKELEQATDHYNENRVLGRGGQGTVYKGMLTDGKIVAVKVSKKVDEGKLEEFINEVVILSQIKHRNIVKLHGCCLETEVPLLVYEFIANGTLLEYIHDQQNDDFPLSWDVRLRIASEVAGALAYLHSAASVPIFHRDIKSSNILLDDKYRAKVADFGTSRSVAVDQTHMTTKVQGTFGYFDPEYFRSSKYTEKSDVYSFGVVLLELLTGQKAILPVVVEEARGLAAYFISSMEEARLFDILDARVLNEGGKEEINAVANLARRCLNLSGKKRPTMQQVAMELETVRTLNSEAALPASMEEQYEEEEVLEEYSITGLSSPWENTSTSITLDIEEKPLMSN